MNIKDNIADIYPLTPVQKNMLYHNRMGKVQDSYIVQICISINGKFDIESFQESCDIISEKYDVLRTVFISRKLSEPKQVVLKKRKVVFEIAKLCCKENWESGLEMYGKEDLLKGYDLSSDTPFRITIFPIHEEKHILFLSFHHIILDGWSKSVLLDHLFYEYDKIVSEKYNLHLVSLDQTDFWDRRAVPSFKDYINYMEKRDKDSQLAFWKGYLADIKHLNGIDVNYETEFADNRGCLYYTLPKELYLNLIEKAKQNKVTLSTVFNTLWGVLLQKYSGSEDQVFSIVTCGRRVDISGIENIVGMLINAVPLRVKCSEEEFFFAVAQKVQSDMNLIEENSYLPIGEIYSTAFVKGDRINNILVFDNYPSQLSSSKKLYELEHIGTSEFTDYEISCNIIPGENLLFKILYDKNRFEDTFILQIARHFHFLAQQVAESHNISIGHLCLNSSREVGQLITFGKQCLAVNPELKETIFRRSEFLRKEIFNGCIILNPKMDLCPIYTYGDLYLINYEQTLNHDHCFNSDQLCNTGLRARWRYNGSIELVPQITSNINFQVKVGDSASNRQMDSQQKQIRCIWANLLKIPEQVIGMDDDFFELGGHSLLTVQLDVELQKLGYIEDDFNFFMKVKQYPTIRKISQLLEEMKYE